MVSLVAFRSWLVLREGLVHTAGVGSFQTTFLRAGGVAVWAAL
jgi:hypothetical protein